MAAEISEDYGLITDNIFCEEDIDLQLPERQDMFNRDIVQWIIDNFTRLSTALRLTCHEDYGTIAEAAVQSEDYGTIV